MRMLFSLTLVLFVVNLARYAGYVVDDVFISLRYARNLVDGLGLVYTPGETVEGYTNFAFVMLAAGFMRLGVDAVLATKVVCMASGIGLLLALERLDRRLAGERQPRLPAVILLLPLSAFAYWSACNMETMLFAFLFVLGVERTTAEAASGRFRGAALVFVAAALTRPEGVFLFALTSAAFALEGLVSGRGRSAVVRAALNAAIFAAVYGVYFAWRYSYFGDIYPNTYYAKVVGGAASATTGFLYLGDGVRALPLLGIAGVVAVGVAVPRLRRRWGFDGAACCIAFLFVGLLAYLISVGGDSMPHFRFFVPVLPLAAVLVGRVVASESNRSGTSIAAAGVALTISSVVASSMSIEDLRAFVAHRTTIVGREVGVSLAKRLPGDALVAVNTAGSLPYFWGGPALDMLGLTDRAIARRPIYVTSARWAGHRRGWGNYVLTRRPQAIFLYNSAGSRDPHYLGDRELAEHPLFRFFYDLRSEALPPPGGEVDDSASWFYDLPLRDDAWWEGSLPSLGLQIERRPGWIPTNVFREAPIVVESFEFNPELESLWDPSAIQDPDVTVLVARAAEHWRRSWVGGDAAERRRVDAMAEHARGVIQAGQFGKARDLLAKAARENGEARSPVVFQYIANLAVLKGDLWTALRAQREALRLDPTNELKASNYRSLLSTPVAEFKGARRAEAP